ncbi:hypothetical protein B7P43_G14743 [Cryptotermes secundus]|uniref:Uncharacterized protein n=1 Tax=Cryptotermes secundus TaxID=105785 RepID=A0A2J7PTW1_9NEOP|nr:hypothetical protein B7P43_G14743 [Cryptotermes secundus]
MLDCVHVGRTWWPYHSLELSRMLLEPILDNSGLMTWCIVLLDYPIVVGVYEVHEGLQMVTKQCNVAVTSQ